ncbi:hypothetical protein PHPALM_27680 [Phytophthora palmivora]|uniref:Crinkler effector protein N-terminal domain-containing protein n=1 Tax=Phytophthora palmivora TaxID=4796 RepID=A0A2P4XC00_9STRA|nr:hypothetical protein PHPALM_27680 [Phytophthora palmivora]
MAMKKTIFYKIVGDDGDAFSMSVKQAAFAGAYLVGDLKEEIKKEKKKPDTIKYEDNGLKLYMAKKEDKMW